MSLGTLGGATSGAFANNNLGQIVGVAQPGPDQWRATLFDPTDPGNNLDLHLPGYASSHAHSINDNGQIVGQAYTTYSDYHAILFDTSDPSTSTNLGTLGGDYGVAASINNKGQIVGRASTASGDRYATLFDPTGAGDNLNLNTCIDPDLGWILKSATGINDLGWIVGYGSNQQGSPCGFLLKPIPEPITLCFLALGAGFLRRRR